MNILRLEKEVRPFLLSDFKVIANFSGFDGFMSDLRVLDEIDIESNRTMIKECSCWIEYLHSMSLLLQVYLDQYKNVIEICGSVGEFFEKEHYISVRFTKLARLKSETICDAIEELQEKEKLTKEKYNKLKMLIAATNNMEKVLTKAYYKILSNINGYGSRFWNTIN